MVVENDYYPPFSRQEYERRHRMLRDGMKERGLDCLLIYGAHHMGGTDMGQVHAVYLSSYAACLHCYVVFPLKGEPTLIIPNPTHLENAKDLSVIEDVRCPGLDVEIGVGQRLKELGLDQGNIGIVGPAITLYSFTIPVEHHSYLAKTFPKANFQVVTTWYESLRLIKSEEEMKYMEKAAAMTGIVYEELLLTTRPGVKHSELRNIVESAVLRLGGRLPFPGHVGSTSMANPTRSYPDFYPTHRTVEAGHMVMTETSVGYGGYFARIFGTYFVGEPTKEYRDLFELAASVHDKAIRELKPGMTGRDAKKWVEPIKEAGYTTRITLLFGWSNYVHPPTAGALDGSPGTVFEKTADLDFVLKPGHCMDIVAWPATHDLKRGLWLGSTCVVTQDGLRELLPYPISKLRVV